MCKSKPRLRIPEASCNPACSCRSQLGFGKSRSVISLPASAISYAPYGDSVFVITDLKDPKGNTYRRRAAAVCEGGRFAW